MPSEAEEQAMVVQYCLLKKYKFWHTPNSTYTKSWRQKAHNRAMGVQAGIPDLFIIVDGNLIAVEMKRQKGGVVSPAQKEWIETLNNIGISAKVCKGAEEAIAFINSMVK